MKEPQAAKANQTATPTPEPAPARRESAHPLLRLQRAVGNQAVQRLVQTKLLLGSHGDSGEQEADRAEDAVTHSPVSLAPATASPRGVPCQRAEPAEGGPRLEARLYALLGGGASLSESTRAFFE